jgi:hypothetical protein
MRTNGGGAKKKMSTRNNKMTTNSNKGVKRHIENTKVEHDLNFFREIEGTETLKIKDVGYNVEKHQETNKGYCEL